MTFVHKRLVDDAQALLIDVMLQGQPRQFLRSHAAELHAATGR